MTTNSRPDEQQARPDEATPEARPAVFMQVSSDSLKGIRFDENHQIPAYVVFEDGKLEWCIDRPKFEDGKGATFERVIVGVDESDRARHSYRAVKNFNLQVTVGEDGFARFEGTAKIEEHPEVQQEQVEPAAAAVLERAESVAQRTEQTLTEEGKYEAWTARDHFREAVNLATARTRKKLEHISRGQDYYNNRRLEQMKNDDLESLAQAWVEQLGDRFDDTVARESTNFTYDEFYVVDPLEIRNKDPRLYQQLESYAETARSQYRLGTGKYYKPLSREEEEGRLRETLGADMDYERRLEQQVAAEKRAEAELRTALEVVSRLAELDHGQDRVDLGEFPDDLVDSITPGIRQAFDRLGIVGEVPLGSEKIRLYKLKGHGGQSQTVTQVQEPTGPDTPPDNPDKKPGPKDERMATPEELEPIQERRYELLTEITDLLREGKGNPDEIPDVLFFFEKKRIKEDLPALTRDEIAALIPIARERVRMWDHREDLVEEAHRQLTQNHTNPNDLYDLMNRYEERRQQEEEHAFTGNELRAVIRDAQDTRNYRGIERHEQQPEVEYIEPQVIKPQPAATVEAVPIQTTTPTTNEKKTVVEEEPETPETDEHVTQIRDFVITEIRRNIPEGVGTIRYNQEALNNIYQVIQDQAARENVHISQAQMDRWIQEATRRNPPITEEKPEEVEEPEDKNKTTTQEEPTEAEEVQTAEETPEITREEYERQLVDQVSDYLASGDGSLGEREQAMYDLIEEQQRTGKIKLTPREIGNIVAQGTRRFNQRRQQ